MVSVEIEKEVDQENKVLGGFTARQIVCLTVASVLFLLVSALLNWNLNLAIYPIAVIAGICGMFGWYKPNGERFEKYLFKYLRAVLYHSNIRHYRTKNKYVVMMNEEYRRRRIIDEKNKELSKSKKKEKKVPSQYKPVK